nr:carboxypeptidase regulatory-like domain-containing protein [Desulfobulbaceae bacterium]
MKKLAFIALVSLLFVFLTNASAGIPGFMKARMGTLKGQVFVDDKPLADAIVSFFDTKGGPPPAIGSARRVPDMVTRTDSQGWFTAQLLPGNFYVGAMVRAVGLGPGPPRAGEEFFFVRNSEGRLRSVAVITKQVVEIGRLDGVPPGKFKEFDDFIVITGKITDENGQPRSGVMVTLKESMSAARPKFVSERTGDDGLYELKVPPGQYYVLARESLQGGRPRTGSFIGTYGKTAPVGDASPLNAGGKSGGAPPGIGTQGGGGEAISVIGKKGEVLSGVDIQLFRIPDPEETRKKFEDEARARTPETTK